MRKHADLVMGWVSPDGVTMFSWPLELREDKATNHYNLIKFEFKLKPLFCCMPDLEKSIWYTNYGVMYTCLPFSCNAHEVLHPGGGAVRGVDGSQSSADPLVQGVKLLPHIRVRQEGLVSLGCRGEGQGLGGRASQGERKVVIT